MALPFPPSLVSSRQVCVVQWSQVGKRGSHSAAPLEGLSSRSGPRRDPGSRCEGAGVLPGSPGRPWCYQYQSLRRTLRPDRDTDYGPPTPLCPSDCDVYGRRGSEEGRRLVSPDSESTVHFCVFCSGRGTVTRSSGDVHGWCPHHTPPTPPPVPSVLRLSRRQSDLSSGWTRSVLSGSVGRRGVVGSREWSG